MELFSICGEPELTRRPKTSLSETESPPRALGVDTHSLFIYLMRVCVCLHEFMCTTHLPGGHRGQKQASDALEQELQIVVSCKIQGPNPGPL